MAITTITMIIIIIIILFSIRTFTHTCHEFWVNAHTHTHTHKTGQFDLRVIYLKSTRTDQFFFFRFLSWFFVCDQIENHLPICFLNSFIPNVSILILFRMMSMNSFSSSFDSVNWLEKQGKKQARVVHFQCIWSSFLIIHCRSWTNLLCDQVLDAKFVCVWNFQILLCWFLFILNKGTRTHTQNDHHTLFGGEKERERLYDHTAFSPPIPSPNLIWSASSVLERSNRPPISFSTFSLSLSLILSCVSFTLYFFYDEKRVPKVFVNDVCDGCSIPIIHLFLIKHRLFPDQKLVFGGNAFSLLF